MTLISLKAVVGCEGYYIDDETFQIYSFKQDYKNGKLMKPSVDNRGYFNYCFRVNGKVKKISLHYIIVKMFIKTDFDSKKEEVDHLNHNKLDNSIENLKVVSRSENQRNKSAYKGKLFNFVNDIGNYLVINEDAGIFYSLENDKFYMFINQTKKYKELHEQLHHGYPCIRYKYNNKSYELSTTYFRKNLHKK